jgi:hypothetical protein
MVFNATYSNISAIYNKHVYSVIVLQKISCYHYNKHVYSVVVFVSVLSMFFYTNRTPLRLGVLDTTLCEKFVSDI